MSMRKETISRIASQFVSALLVRRSPQMSCRSDDKEAEQRLVADELAEIVSTVVAAIPNSADPNEVHERLSEAVRPIRESFSTRSWPRAEEIGSKVRRLFQREDTGGIGERHPRDFEDGFKEWAVRFIRRGHTPPTKYWDADFAQVLLDEKRISPADLEATKWLTPDRRRALGLPAGRARGSEQRVDAMVRGVSDPIAGGASLEQHRQRQRLLAEELKAELTEEQQIEREIQLWESRLSRAGLDADVQANAELRLKELRAQLERVRGASA